jgi:hypothetical protein
VWVPRVPVVAPLHRLVGMLAGASLYIYLTQWQTFPWLRAHGVDPLSTTLLALAAGVLVWVAAERAVPAVRSRAAAARARVRSAAGLQYSS